MLVLENRLWGKRIRTILLLRGQVVRVLDVLIPRHLVLVPSLPLAGFVLGSLVPLVLTKFFKSELFPVYRKSCKEPIRINLQLPCFDASAKHFTTSSVHSLRARFKLRRGGLLQTLGLREER